MENQNLSNSTVERWLLRLRWGHCLLGVVIGCVCTSVLGLSIGLIAHPSLTSMSSCSNDCSDEINWGPCSDMCNKGTQMGIKQIRQTINGKCVTISNTSVKQLCRTDRNCLDDGGWSRWEQYGSCSVTCGQGVVPIIRKCDSPVPMNNGKYCDGQSFNFGTCFVEPCKENLAFGKQTKQSSLHSALYSHFGVDGEICTNDHNRCTHTRKNYHAWWAVDLGDEFNINEVVLYGRTDCCTDRLSNFDIDVFKSRISTRLRFSLFDRGILSRCHYHPGKVVNHVLNATCKQGTSGQFVRVRLRGSNYLTLCEVKVYGTRVHQNLIKNLAFGKQTKQSSLHSALYSHFGVDGEICTNDHNRCTHTQKNYHAWWAVDLGDEFNINEVVLYGRTDCCTDRLSNFDIDVFKSRISTRLRFSLFDRGILSRCHYHPGKVVNHVLNATCKQGTSGQFVRVRLRGSNYLTLCEVKVYGTRVHQNLITDRNWKYGEPYLGPGVGRIKDITEDKCSSLCLFEENQLGCITSFIRQNNTCIVVGSSGKTRKP